MLASLLLGCAMSQTRPAPAAGPLEDLPILWEGSGTYSRIGRSVRVVVRDQAALARIPVAEFPVDFDRQMVLIVGLGPTAGSGVGVRITRVWRSGETVRVQEQRIHPGPDSGRKPELASPWAAVIVPRVDLNVEGFSTDIPEGLMLSHAGRR